MKISQNTVVSLKYSMFDDKGRLIDKCDEPVAYLHGSFHSILRPLESALENRTSGETVKISMPPEEAFGHFEPSLIREEDISLFPDDIEVGTLLEAVDTHTGKPQRFRIVRINENKVTVDGNHPLAGVALRFEATVMEVRQATQEEIEHGHVHDGSQHYGLLH